MITQLVAFETEEDLQKLTGLNHEDLWANDFDLDDWDIGFQSNIKLHRDYTSEEIEEFKKDNEFFNPNYSINFDWDSPCYWLLRQMDNYCVGMKYTEYKNKHYYMVYHS